MGEKFLLIFRVKVCILPYHSALDVVATNLHTMFFINNIPNFVFDLCFQIPYNQILRKKHNFLCLGTLEVEEVISIGKLPHLYITA